jgi:hypothetical protein
MREGISTNARSKIYYTASPDDARDLARHTTPRLTDHDLAHLGAYHAAARLVLHGQQTEPFTLTTSPLPPPTPGRARDIRRALHTHTTPASGTSTAPTQAGTTSPPPPGVPGRVAAGASPPHSIDPRRSR